MAIQGSARDILTNPRLMRMPSTQQEWTQVMQELAQYSGGTPKGLVYIDDYPSPADLMGQIYDDGGAFKVIMGDAVYDFDGVKIPVQTELWGFGASANPDTQTNGTRISGVPIQYDSGGHGNFFHGITFQDGIEIYRQFTRFDHCGFGGQLLFDGRAGLGRGPYRSLVNHCYFRVPSETCIRLKGTANAVNIKNSAFRVGASQRGIVAEYSGGAPQQTGVEGCQLEAITPASTVGSFVYGAFNKGLFLNNYIDTNRPTFSDGGEFVFDSNANDNRVYAFNRLGDKAVFNSSRNMFYHSADSIYVSSGTPDFGTYSGVPDLYAVAGSVTAVTMPPLDWVGAREFRFHNRTTGTVVMNVSDVATETIQLNGAAGATAVNIPAGEIFDCYCYSSLTVLQVWKIQ